MTGKSFLLKHLFDREKPQTRKLKVCQGNGPKADSSILSTFEKLRIQGEMCGGKERRKKKTGIFILFFFNKRKNLMLFLQNLGANHERASLRARTHWDVSSVAHYNSAPDLEERHGSKSCIAPVCCSAEEGKRG